MLIFIGFYFKSAEEPFENTILSEIISGAVIDWRIDHNILLFVNDSDDKHRRYDDMAAAAAFGRVRILQQRPDNRAGDCVVVAQEEKVVAATTDGIVIITIIIIVIIIIIIGTIDTREGYLPTNIHRLLYMYTYVPTYKYIYIRASPFHTVNNGRVFGDGQKEKDGTRRV